MCCGVKKEDQKGYPKYLDAHELYSINYRTGEVRLGYIVSLCHSMCHRGVHFGRLTSEFDKGNISEEEFLSVISHANTLCKENNLPMKNWDVDVNDNLSCNIPWNNWRLILNIEGEEKSAIPLLCSMGRGRPLQGKMRADLATAFSARSAKSRRGKLCRRIHKLRATEIIP